MDVNQPNNILTVSGEGVIQIEPDRAVVTLGASTKDIQANVAQRNNAEIINELIRTFNELNITKEDIRTTDFRIDLQHDYEDGKQVFRGYEVVHLLEVIIKDIEQTGTIIDAAIANGANTVTNLQFTVADTSSLYKDALASALNNAQAKANLLAKTLNVALNKVPHKITEITETSSRGDFQVATFTRSAATSVMTGQIEIKAAVSVQFTYDR